MSGIVRCLIVVGMLTCTAWADVVGPLVRVDGEFPNFAVFQVNGESTKPGAKVVVRRGRLEVAEGKVTQVASGKCLVQFKEEPSLHRGDLLHSKGSSPSIAPVFGKHAPQLDPKRTSLTRRRVTKLKKGRSPHVLSPKEMAEQSRRTSVYSLGNVGGVKSMATQSRNSSVYTLGRTLTVKELSQQMSW